jgi:tetratricopeptide (TPR) repeat protein
VLGEDHPHTAQSYNNVAANLGAQGQHAQAEPLLQKALAICRRVLGEDHPDTALSYNNVAYNLYAQGQYREAATAWADAARSFEAARLAVTAAGLDRAAFGARLSPLPPLAACLARLGQPTDAWQRLEQHLARGLLDEAAARTSPTRTPDELRRQQELLGRRQQFDTQITALLARPGKLDAVRAPLQQLSRQRAEVQAQLSRLDAEWSRREVLDLPRIQAQLPADAALVAWVDVAAAQAAGPHGEHWACLVKHRGPPVWVRLPGCGTAGAWTEADDWLPGAVAFALTFRGGPATDDWPQLRQRLYRQRLAPLESHLKGVRQLLAVPAGVMAGVPVEALSDRFTVSYVPSGSVFARLREQRPPAAPAALLAVGDPTFTHPQAAAAPPPPLPEHGLLLTQVLPGGNAQQSGLRPGDVLLRYGDTKLTAPDDLRPAEGGVAVAVQVWRDGQVREVKVRPGRLGVGLARAPAPVALRQRREADALLRSVRGADPEPLPGTRREVEALAQLFARADVLLGSDANEQRLEALAQEGRLKQYGYLHLATHGVIDVGEPKRSALLLARDRLPDPLAQAQAGRRVYEGRLTMADVLRDWQLEAELVTLSACETALGAEGGGDGFVGFSQALLLAGARSLVVSLWKVDDTATALLMQRFYQNLLGKRDGLEKPLPKAAALREAKHWLRDLTAEQIDREVAGLPKLERGGVRPRPGGAAEVRPYAHPYYWSAFILIGDPD